MQDMERKYEHNYMWLLSTLNRRLGIVEEQTFKKQTRQAVKIYIESMVHIWKINETEQTTQAACVYKYAVEHQCV